MALRDMPISSSLETCPKVLKILVLRGIHSMELIMPLLNKVIKSNIFRLNICSYGGLVLLSRPKVGLSLFIIMGGWLGERSRGAIVCRWGRGRCEMNNLVIIG